MYAILEIAGQQFKVTKDQKIYVHRLENAEGSKVEFDKILLIDNDKEVIVGEPIIEKASVTATVISHVKGDKVKIFKKKRRKGYQKLNGHRQYLSQIQIDNISEKGEKKSSTKKAVVAEKVEEVKETVSKKSSKAESKSEE
ncbi:MAG: 50S ribosomal protein L21 [Bacteroidota bacterium]